MLKREIIPPNKSRVLHVIIYDDKAVGIWLMWITSSLLLLHFNTTRRISNCYDPIYDLDNGNEKYLKA